VSEPATKSAKKRKPNVGSDPTKGSRVKQWQYGLYAFALGGSLVLVAANLINFAKGNFIPTLLIVTALFAALSWSLVAARDEGYVEPEGLPVASSEPELTEFVHGIAQQVNASEPTKIYLTTDAEFGLRERTRFFGLKVYGSDLVLGLPYLHALSRQEFASLVAHELAHVADGEIGEGRRAFRTLNAAAHMIKSERGNPLNGAFGSYARKVFRSVGGVGTAQEAAADEIAAKLYGSAALASALGKHDAIAVTHDELLRDWVVPALQNRLHPTNMFVGFRQVLEDPDRSADRARTLLKRQDKVPGEFVLHRCPAERLAALEGAPTHAGEVQLTDADEPASTLLDPEAKSEDITVGKWASGLMGSTTSPRTWDELANQIYSVSASSSTYGFEQETADAEDRFERAMEWSESGDFTASGSTTGSGVRSLSTRRVNRSIRQRSLSRCSTAIRTRPGPHSLPCRRLLQKQCPPLEGTHEQIMRDALDGAFLHMSP